MSKGGATATSNAVAGNVRVEAVTELTSMAEMRRIAAGDLGAEIGLRRNDG